MTEHGRPPVGTGEPAERALAQWVSRQRSLEKGGKLSPRQQAVLDEVPGWRTTGRAARDAERWQEKLTGTAAYLAEHGRWPSYQHHKSEHERALGVWMHTQRQADRKGTLTVEKRKALDARLPGWSGDRRRRNSRLPHT